MVVWMFMKHNTVFIVVDDSAFTYVRIAITTTSIDKKSDSCGVKELNTLNQDYKISKCT